MLRWVDARLWVLAVQNTRNTFVCFLVGQRKQRVFGVITFTKEDLSDAGAHMTALFSKVGTKSFQLTEICRLVLPTRQRSGAFHVGLW